jgi:hypothetical protein
MIHTLHPFCSRDNIEKNGMREAYKNYGVVEKRTQGFGGET